MIDLDQDRVGDFLLDVFFENPCVGHEDVIADDLQGGAYGGVVAAGPGGLLALLDGSEVGCGSGDDSAHDRLPLNGVAWVTGRGRHAKTADFGR